MVARDPSSKPVSQPAGASLVAPAAGVTVAVLGATVLAAWATGADLVIRLRPGLPSMKPATAVCLVALGVALVAVGARRRHVRRLAVPAATVAAAVAALSLVARAGGPPSPVEELMFPAAVMRDPSHGHPAGATCLLVLLLAASLVTRASGRPGYELAAQALGVAALVGSLLAALDHLYGDRAPYLGNVRSIMAVHTAAGLALASVGALAAVPGGLVNRVLDQSGPGSAMRRRLLLVVTVALPAIGWLRLEGERLGLYGTSFGVAVTTVAGGALVYAAAWSATGAADRSGAMLRDAWQRLGMTNARLERRIAEQAQELAEARARLRGVLAVLGDVAVVVTDADGRVAMASARALELLGHTEAEVAGQPLAALDRFVRHTADGRVHVLAEDVDVTLTTDVTDVGGVADALEPERG